MHHYNHSPLDPLRVSASNTPEPSSSSAMRYNVGRTSARNLSAGDSHDGRTEVRNPLCCNSLCVRKLMQLDSDGPSPAKVAAVENAISQAASIWSA